MNWNTWTDFVHMGGYAFYVWGSFGMTALLVAGELFFLRRYGRRAMERARRGLDLERTVAGHDESAE